MGTADTGVRARAKRGRAHGKLPGGVWHEGIRDAFSDRSPCGADVGCEARSFPKGTPRKTVRERGYRKGGCHRVGASDNQGANR